MSALTTFTRIAVMALLYVAVSPAQARSPPPPNQLATTADTARAEGSAATVAAPADTNPTRPQTPATRSTPLSIPAVVVQPRLSGYFVGDVVTQRVLLEGDSTTDTPAVHLAPSRPTDTAAPIPAPGGKSAIATTERALARQHYTPVTLPSPGRVNTWFERRRTATDTDTSGRHWLIVEYQFLNAPKAVTAATLPAWLLTVKASAAAPPITLSIPAASLNIAPLSPPGSPHQVGTRDLRPYRVAPNIVTTPILHAIAITSTGLAVTIAAWLAWVLWRNKRAAAHQPFARALHELRAVSSDEPRAWQILHRAFDRVAGRVIQTATLPTLFERAPQLAPARRQIEAFFTQSNSSFFANGHSPSPRATRPPTQHRPTPPPTITPPLSTP